MKVAILTSLNQWFIPYAQKLQEKIDNSSLYFEHKDIKKEYDVLFILSYHNIIEEEYLNANYNIVIHASKLPQGKGWAPMFWQILENKNVIPFTMFEASNGVDNGDVYMQKDLLLNGFELHDELRSKQADFTIDMCLEFLKKFNSYKESKKQEGKESFYKKRGPLDSQLDINKTIEEQFNLLRIVDNENYPAFFYKNGKKYILKIEEEK